MTTWVSNILPEWFEFFLEDEGDNGHIYTARYIYDKVEYEVTWTNSETGEEDNLTSYGFPDVCDNIRVKAWILNDYDLEQQVFKNLGMTVDETVEAPVPQIQENEEYTGSSSSYYGVSITHPTTASNVPYFAECNDIIEALGMTFAEGNAFKAIWRMCAARTLGKKKKGNTDVYDAEKVVFFADRMLIQAKLREDQS